METDAENWKALAHRLGIDIIAPFDVELSGVQMHFTALLPQFGAPAGMVIDTDWTAIEPHQSSLRAAGYGFACVEPGDPTDIISAQEMLSDWGWTSTSPKPDWLQT